MPSCNRPLSNRYLTCLAAAVIDGCVEAVLTKFAPVKLNLFLEVMGKRSDGYHEIDTIMETVAVGDLVSVTPCDGLLVSSNRTDVPENEDNTCFKIIRAAERKLGRSLPARVLITKVIPPGTGLGAGSSDAVAALELVLALHGVQLDANERRSIASEVGSDVPFFVTGGVARCTGRGDVVTPVPSRGARHYVLVLSGAPCPTADVYNAHTPQPRTPAGARPWIDALNSGMPTPPPLNHLEAAALTAFPWLAEVRSRLREVTGRDPVLSGSGSTWWFPCASYAEASELESRLIAGDPQLMTFRTASYSGERG